jgi:hypothetical protein
MDSDCGKPRASLLVDVYLPYVRKFVQIRVGSIGVGLIERVRDFPLSSLVFTDSLRLLKLKQLELSGVYYLICPQRRFYAVPLHAFTIRLRP